MITVKLSYSILNAWASGQQEQAVGMYLGQPLPPTVPMELGKSYDEVWNQYIDKNKRLPIEFGGDALNEPRTQIKYAKYIDLTDDMRILVRGVPDCVDGEIIHENKCGMTEPSSYVDTAQLDYYKLLYPQATLGLYHCYNPYFDTYKRGVKFLTRANAEAALEHIITYGSDFIQYLEANRLLIDYKEEVPA